jgi:cell wall-associated NlpC family hydrolase
MENDIQNIIVTEAKKLLNTPFRHRGRTRHGVDCLGFCWLAFRRAGLTHIPDGDRKNYEVNWFWFADEERYLDGLLKYFYPVDIPLPGDLVTFRIFAKKITHAGIYEKDNFFIHARSGRRVQRDSLDQKYWQNRFSGFMRLKNLEDI